MQATVAVLSLMLGTLGLLAVEDGERGADVGVTAAGNGGTSVLPPPPGQGGGGSSTGGSSGAGGVAGRPTR